MKKNTVKALVLALVCLTVLASLVACGESAKPATVTAVYTYYVAPMPSIDMTESYGVVMYMPTYTVVELFDDGTYVSEKIDVGYWGTDGGATVRTTTTVFGTYTLTPDAVDDEKATIALSAGTRVITSSDMTMTAYSYDTADEATFEGAETTAAELLATATARTLTVNTVKKIIESGLE